ncbi:MAG: serine hydrolase [Saprospiraceae bacterium]
MKKIVLSFVSLCLYFYTFSQTTSKAALENVILSHDSLLFNIGFNTCDIRQFEQLLSDDFEFYHDKDSICLKTEFLQKLRTGLCKSPESYQSRRELITESTEIFPLYKNKTLYGAIQSGLHRFYETNAGKKETFASSARFTHVWILEKGVWKLKRSLSYDHKNSDVDLSAISIFDHEQEIEKWLSENHIPTLGVGVINDGKLQKVKVYGALQKGVSAPYNTIFNVASLTKPITAIVVLKLASQGKWNLDEPICKYWTDPDVAQDPYSKKLSSRHILSQQSGFANWRWNNADEKLHFEFEPGTKYQYSGEGFEYLRKAVENKFHKSLDQLAKQLIFDPLQMNDTQFFWDAKTDSNRYAIGYDNKSIPYPIVKTKSASAADDLLTTVEDYGKFLCSVMNADGLSKTIYEDMIKNQVDTKKGKHFGLGFEIYYLKNGDIALSHGGSDKGAQTIFFILPKTKQGLIIFTNVDEGYKVYEKIITHYLGKAGNKIIEIETSNSKG